MKRKKTDLYTERQTVSLTPEQMRRVQEMRSGRGAQGGRLAHPTALDRPAAPYHPPGSRRAIAKGVEAKLDALDEKVETLTTTLNDFIERVTRRRGQ